jgi:hypothetical protein
MPGHMRYLNRAAIIAILLCSFVGITACEDAKAFKITGAIRGTAGSPRFNLQFTNGINNDVDLYVETPNGLVISYRTAAVAGEGMDIDCSCGDCPNGANENIYWLSGTAPKGIYKAWVQYFDPCMGSNGTADYVLRIMDNEKVLKICRGKVSTASRKSAVYVFVFE